jgi:hypothetical protein
MTAKNGAALSRWQIPDDPPRRRERSTQRRLPAILLIVGIALTVVGLLATVGPLALDLGGTDSPPADDPADDQPGPDSDADDGGESEDAGDANGDGASGSDEPDGAGADGIRAAIGDVFSGHDDHEEAGDERPEECPVE